MNAVDFVRATRDPNVTVSFEIIGPTEAEELLSKSNLRNRKVRDGRVHQYARDMRNDRWEYVDCISINSLGTLNNGQHRLLGVIEGGVPVEFVVLRGVKPTAQDVTDQGLTRKFSDVLHLHSNVPSAVSVAAAIKQIYLYQNAKVFGSTSLTGPRAQPSYSELLELYQQHKDIVDALPVTQKVRRSGVLIATGVCMALFYIFREIDPVDGPVFFEKLAYGADLSETDAIFVLRRLFLGVSRPTSARVQAALIIKAFNAWRDGDEVKQLSWRGGGSKAEKFPQIAPAQRTSEELQSLVRQLREKPEALDESNQTSEAASS